MLTFDRIKEALNEKIPEILGLPAYREMMEFWHGDDVPTYVYYSLLEGLLLNLLRGKIHNDSLLQRVMNFMEEMAASDDIEVQNLLVVEILEALFELDYATFNRVMDELCGPKTRELFVYPMRWLIPPRPPATN